MPKRNPFGYLAGHCPSYQLQMILKLKNNRDVYQLLKTNILGMIAKHLDVKHLISKQKEALEAIKIEMTEQYPDIFATEESEKRIYYAFRFISYAHAARRHKLKQSTQPTRKDMTPSISQRTRSKSMKRRSPSLPLTSESIQEPITQLLPQPYPINVKRDTTPSNSSYAYPTQQHRAIHRFLEASLPPLTHLTDIFIDFGCVNTAFLLAISSWPFERIKFILDQLPPGRDGRKMTEMEKFILQNHFKDYFAQLL